MRSLDHARIQAAIAIGAIAAAATFATRSNGYHSPGTFNLTKKFVSIASSRRAAKKARNGARNRRAHR